jgi:hypothetical protein
LHDRKVGNDYFSFFYFYFSPKTFVCCMWTRQLSWPVSFSHQIDSVDCYRVAFLLCDVFFFFFLPVVVVFNLKLQRRIKPKNRGEFW